MATITIPDYVQIPFCATPLHPSNTNPTVLTRSSLPDTDTHNNVPSTSTPTNAPPSMSPFTILPSLLLSSTLPLPTSAPLPTSSSIISSRKGPPPLLTTRDPLAIPTISANFRRFVSVCGPYFWIQDRLEEVVMWRRGWKVTGGWMAAYTFLCYYPRLIFLIPHITIIAILLSTHPSLSSPSPKTHSTTAPQLRPVPTTTTQEGSPIWQANLQGIQNLMGAYSDLIDAVQPLLPYLTHRTPYTPHILTTAVLSVLFLLPILPLLSMRILALAAGLVPFALTHPFTCAHVLPLGVRLARCAALRARLTRMVDDSNLDDRHWNAEMREVELWENERWSPSAEGGWGKTYLKIGERCAWTRGRDGWSGVKEDGSGDVSNLTFALPPGWSFVETEDWRPDIEATWVTPGIGSDDDGWVYTNDAWLDAHSAPLEAWKTTGMTRRRRWVRRIYYSHSSPPTVC